MANNVKIIKGKVVVKKEFSEQELLKKKSYASKKFFEFWETKHDSLEFMEQLEFIEELGFITAKINDPSALTRIKSLKKLYLNGAKINTGYSVLKKMSQLEKLHLLNHRGDIEIPNLKTMSSLKSFRVWSCKRFKDVSILHDVKELEEIELVDTAVTLEDTIPLFEIKSVKYISVSFGTQKLKSEFEEYLVKYNKQRYPF